MWFSFMNYILYLKKANQIDIYSVYYFTPQPMVYSIPSFNFLSALGHIIIGKLTLTRLDTSSCGAKYLAHTWLLFKSSLFYDEKLYTSSCGVV